MREIKYRQVVYDADGRFSHWVYWGFTEDHWDGPAIAGCTTVANAKRLSLQYTGKKDRSGSEIYVYDVLETGTKHKLRYTVLPDESTAGFTGYPHQGSECTALPPYKWDEATVIGNVIESPELSRLRAALRKQRAAGG